MPNHHPNAQALANLLIGDCSPGASLLLAQHVQLCAQCAIRVQALGAPAGAALAVEFEPPRMLRPGLQMARVQGVSGLGEAVFRLRADPGEALNIEGPFHVAEILVLEGGLFLGEVRYLAGDFLSVGHGPADQLTSDAERGCVCLVACTDGDDGAAFS
jgi:anti-sigma factor ChrR (cupin superfamily)